jgi:hypothetical protein
MKHPVSRETKPCPKCDETAVFRDRVMRPTGNAPARNHLIGSEFVAAWKCENEGCDYFEEWVEDAGSVE